MNASFVLQSDYGKSESRPRYMLVWDKWIDHHHHPPPPSVDPFHQHCFFLTKDCREGLALPQPSPHWLQTWETRRPKKSGWSPGLPGFPGNPARLFHGAYSRDRPQSRIVLVGPSLSFLTLFSKVDYTAGGGPWLFLYVFHGLCSQSFFFPEEKRVCNDSNLHSEQEAMFILSCIERWHKLSLFLVDLIKREYILYPTFLKKLPTKKLDSYSIVTTTHHTLMCFYNYATEIYQTLALSLTFV